MAKIITIIYNQSDNIEQTPPNYELQQNNLKFNIDDKSKAFSINKPFEFDDNIKSKIYDIGSSILCLKKKDFLNINHMEKNTFSSDENSDKNINLNLKYTSMSKDIDLDLEPLYHSSKDCISFCFPEKSKREIKDTSQSSVLGSKAHDFITSCTTFNETKSYTENSSSYCTKKTNTSFKKFKNQTYIIGNISYMENHITYLLFYDIYKLLNYNLNFSVKLNNKFISNYQLINDINVLSVIIKPPIKYNGLQTLNSWKTYSINNSYSSMVNNLNLDIKQTIANYIETMTQYNDWKKLPTFDILIHDLEIIINAFPYNKCNKCNKCNNSEIIIIPYNIDQVLLDYSNIIELDKFILAIRFEFLFLFNK